MKHLKLFEQYNKEEKKEYYVEDSSWFDTHSYNHKTITKAVKDGGGDKVHLENKFGWSNQPEVVVFSANENNIDQIKKAVQKAVGTDSIIIREKDKDKGKDEKW